MLPWQVQQSLSVGHREIRRFALSILGGLGDDLAAARRDDRRRARAARQTRSHAVNQSLRGSHWRSVRTRWALLTVPG